VKLPNRDRAVIDQTKVQDYLLSPSHPVGRFKAAFFSSLGYSQDRWRQLEMDLRHQHVIQDVHRVTEFRYGQKFEIRANLKGPSGRAVEVVSVWIVPTDEDTPRLVTAYPGEQ
jgi:hypothetical protein